jgi:hypothetical protein
VQTETRNLHYQKEVIMKGIKNYFAPVDSVNAHIPET